MKKENQQYIIRKYIIASSALQAIQKDKTTPVQEVWIDEKWRELQMQQKPSAIGFSE